MNHAYKETDTKSKIFHIAAHLFSHNGYNGVSMREISEKSGVSKPTIYYYFKNKEKIYAELLEAGISLASENLVKIRDSALSAPEKLAEILRFRFQASIDHPDFSRFFLSLYSSQGQFPFMEKYRHKMHHHRKIVRDIVLQGISDNDLNSDLDVELFIDMIGSISINFSRLYIFGTETRSPKMLAQSVMNYLLKGAGAKKHSTIHETEA
jgi:AcrR family transcriptional regulator